ncbi:MAG: hypothetical protein LC749_02585, partial [Actinobacteria bacterium]|nr:hypothetical protein [Actinomycetota bacterium]
FPPEPVMAERVRVRDIDNDEGNRLPRMVRVWNSVLLRRSPTATKSTSFHRASVPGPTDG